MATVLTRVQPGWLLRLGKLRVSDPPLSASFAGRPSAAGLPGRASGA